MCETGGERYRVTSPSVTFLPNSGNRWFQMSGLALTFCFTLVNLIVAPSMNALMVERNAMEAKEGIGKGVADHNQAIKKFKEENSEYAAIYSRLVRSSLCYPPTYSSVVLCLDTRYTLVHDSWYSARAPHLHKVKGPAKVDEPLET